MDSHEYYEELILKDGDLSGEERKNLKAHLEECEKCQKLEEQRWLSAGDKYNAGVCRIKRILSALYGPVE